MRSAVAAAEREASGASGGLSDGAREKLEAILAQAEEAEGRIDELEEERRLTLEEYDRIYDEADCIPD